MGKRKKFVITAISGNEERWAEQWAKSIMRANPDLVIFNLTQFDDKTEELIRQHIPEDKLILLKNEWQKSFSAARNQSLEPIPKDTDYVMYVDMDEIITETSYTELESFLHSEYPPVQVLCNIYNAVSKDSMVASLYYPRIWPHKAANGDLINEYFDGEVHNQLVMGEVNDIYALRSKISLYHYGYALDKESMAAKHKRSEELLQNQLNENQENFFAHLNLAQLLRAKGNYKEALEHSLIVLNLVSDKTGDPDQRYLYAYIMAKDQAATCLLAKQDYDESIKHSEDALRVKPDHLDSIMNTAHAYLNMQSFDEAEFWLKRYLFIRARYDETKDNTNLILNHLNSSFIALYHLGMIYLQREKFEQAADYYKKTFEQDPGFRDAFVKYIHCLSRLGKKKEVNDEVNRFMRTKPDKAYQIYEYFGDIELEQANVENSKFNFYQALYINKFPEDSPDQFRIKQKFECLSQRFGEVSHNYFDTTEKREALVNRTNG